MNRLCIVLTVAAVVAMAPLLVSCGEGTRYPVRVAPIAPAAKRGVYWVDNDSVLYAGMRGDRHATPPPPRQVVIWNTRDNSVKDVGELGTSFDHICYSDGYISFRTRYDGNDVIVKEGLLASLSERRVPENEIGEGAARKRGEVPNRFTCRYLKLADLGPRSNCLTPLREGDGYLDLTGGYCTEKVKDRLEEIAKLPDWDMGRARSQLDGELRAQPVVYLTMPTGRAIQLPIKAGEVGASTIGYSSFSDSYVLRAHNTVPPAPGSQWPKGQPHPIYLVGRDALVRRVDMPYTSWNKGELAEAVVTRIGVLVISYALGRNYDVGHAGIYRIAGDRLELVLRGYFLGIAVSPNGCRLAAIVQDRKTFAFRVIAIDVCIGRK